MLQLYFILGTLLPFSIPSGLHNDISISPSPLIVILLTLPRSLYCHMRYHPDLLKLDFQLVISSVVDIGYPRRLYELRARWELIIYIQGLRKLILDLQNHKIMFCVPIKFFVYSPHQRISFNLELFNLIKIVCPKYLYLCGQSIAVCLNKVSLHRK